MVGDGFGGRFRYSAVVPGVGVQVGAELEFVLHTGVGDGLTGGVTGDDVGRSVVGVAVGRAGAGPKLLASTGPAPAVPASTMVPPSRTAYMLRRNSVISSDRRKGLPRQ
ncbi:hypothetical protein Areg01_21060 [Actinoplanes regularis]|nr:hypothetical protein Areg01_21060 [Actinoplanes regularis]